MMHAKLPTLCYVLLIVLFYYIEEGIQYPATIRLLENAICHQHYARAGDTNLPVDETLCKIGVVQDRLAFIRGWYSFWTTLPVLLLGTFFGDLADKFGRRRVLSLAVFGMICGLAWVFVTCNFWDSLPLELAWLTALCRCVGGGPFVAIALYMTMASDLSTDENRSQILYVVSAFKFGVEIIAPQLASVLLRHSLWLPYLICGISLFMIFPCIAMMPETLPLKQASDAAFPSNFTESNTNPFSYMRFFTNKAVALGLVVDFLLQFRYNTLQILIPFISVRFSWAIEKAAKLLSIIPGVSLILFVALTFLTDMLRRRWSLRPARFNVLVLRAIIFALAAGVLLIAVSASIGAFVFALVIFAIGFNTRAPVLAYISGHIDPVHDTARLYTLISILDAFVHMAGSPLIEILWARGLDIGGDWLALPFIISGLFYLAALILAVLLPYPPTTDPSMVRNASREHSPLLATTGEEEED
ncbi:MFS general substrate transporter [Cenococcum geophilum]